MALSISRLSLEDKFCTVRDGRTLCYLDTENADGKPVLIFHGFPGTRLQRLPDEELPLRKGLRLITIDRPGCGLSDFKPRRTLLDWADDVVDLTEHLGLKKFSIVGWSGGGPYALACAYRIPERLEKVALMCALGPMDRRKGTKGMANFNRLTMAMSRHLPWLSKIQVSTIAQLVKRRPDTMLRIFESQSPPSEREWFANSEFREALIKDVQESLRQGNEGTTWDLRLYPRPWGFELQEIKPQVRLWHGAIDSTVPVQMGHFIAEQVPNCEATFLPDAGHMIPATHAKDLVHYLAS